MEPVRKLSQVIEAMDRLHEDLPKSPELAGRLGQAHAFYYLADSGGNGRFGFSKFVGYPGLTAEAYLNNYKALDGRNTEHALKPWFEEVSEGSSTYDELFGQLSDWLAQFGKRPRSGKDQRARIMVLKPEFAEEESQPAADRRLLDLILAVVEMLPIDQRRELRAKL